MSAASRFPVRVTIAGIALGAGLVLATACDARPSAEALAEQRVHVEALLGIAITTQAQDLRIDTVWGPLIARSAPVPQVNHYLPLLCVELRKYPPELIARVGLRQFVLCRELSLAGQARTALPMLDPGTLYIDVERGSYSPSYQRITLHHELMHAIDERDDGKVYEDPDWAALNAPDFRYGRGGANAQGDPYASLYTSRFRGFLTSYSTSGVEEDKAELFARLMVEPSYVMKRSAQDEILRTKVARLKQLLASFCPKFDERAWPTDAPVVK